MKGRLFLEYTSQKWFIYVFAVLLYGLLSYLILSTLTVYRNYTYKIDLAEQAKFDQDILIQLPLGSFGRNEGLEDLYQSCYDTIGKTDGVESFICAQSFNADAGNADNSHQFYLDVITDLKYGDAKYALCEGTWPDAPNEVVLTEYAKNFYRVGDTIRLDMATVPELISRQVIFFQLVPVELKVTGFISDSAQMFYYGKGSGRPTLDTLYSTGKDLNESLGVFSEDEGRYFAVHGVIFQPTSTDGVRIQTDGEGTKYIIRLKDSADASQIAAGLEGKIPGVIMIGSKLISDYRDSHQTEILLAIRNMILILLLCIAGTLLTINVTIRKRRPEIAMLAIAGVSPRRVIASFYLSFLPAILISWALGLAAFMKMREAEETANQALIFSLQDIPLSLGILFLVVALLLIPGFLLSSSHAYLDDVRKEV